MQATSVATTRRVRKASGCQSLGTALQENPAGLGPQGFFPEES